MIGLVLEGGGMRGIFTAGILDCFIDYKVDFDYVIGTSAGATTGISYVSRQKNRTRFCDTDLMRMHNYIGFKPMIEGHGVIDMDFLFETFPGEYYPFDFETYFKSGKRVVMVSTDAETGSPVYFEEYDSEKRMTACARASCSLPIMCPMCEVDGRMMVDGGVSDSIPFGRALSDGCDKVVVVLTKELGYRKENKRMYLPSIVYRKYPSLREALCIRNISYNRQLQELEELERQGKALVIRPLESYGVGRTTDDVDKLEMLYDHGYDMALEYLNNISTFVKE